MNRFKHLLVLALALVASGGLAYKFVPDFELVKMIVLAVLILIGSDVFYQIDKNIAVHLNDKVKAVLTKDSFILTSGHKRVWDFISGVLGLDCYSGAEMAAETKFFITKHLQNADLSDPMFRNKRETEALTLQ